MTETRPSYRAGPTSAMFRLKGVIDRALAVVCLLVLAPLLLIVAATIRVDSPGPVFYRQVRAGRGGREFPIYKFRTMVHGAEHIGLGRNVTLGDERITRVGQWLRRASIDELPQLLNVVLGQMSVVGPRPAPIAHLQTYTDRQRRRLEVRPGITGWAQVNGRNSLSWEDRIELDIWYIDHWSPRLDLRIVLRTPRALLSTRHLYGEDGVTTDLRAFLEAAEQGRTDGGAPGDHGAA